MKCSGCGGNLSLEDEMCPHCGRVNQDALQHIRDMRRYSGEFEETKQDVYKTTRRYSEISSRVILLAILVVLVFICLISEHFYYQISNTIQRKASESRASSYCAILDDYIEDEEYLEIDKFVKAKRIDCYNENYEKYGSILRVSGSYSNLYLKIMELSEAEEEDIPGKAKELADEMEYFYKRIYPEQYGWQKELRSEQEEAVLENMEENVRLLLMTYCGLTREETEKMKTMTSSRRAILIEEGVVSNE